jgi:hypothetical protein
MRFAICAKIARIRGMRNLLRIPWTGTLSVQPKVQQKLIRVVSSAAVCGLSFSFIIGEAVDQKAKSLALWEINSTIFPTQYSPVGPVLEAYSNFPYSRAQENWVAMNSFQPGQLPEPAPMPAFQDSLKVILASTEKPAEQVTSKQRGFPAEKEKSEDQLILGSDDTAPQQDVREILVSIQDAQSKLQPKSEPKQDYSVITSGNVMVKMIEEGGRGVDNVSQGDALILGSPQSPSSRPPTPSMEPMLPSPKLEAEKPKEEKTDWLINGKILSAGKTEKGHFEVGVFSRIDQDGFPVGYPIVQKILPAGITEFSVKIPKNLEKAYLFGEFVASKSGKRTWLSSDQSLWTRSQNTMAELRHGSTDTVSSIAAATIANTESGKLKITGSVSTLFVKEGVIPQEDVVVKVRGRKEAARTDRQGNFQLEVPAVNGTVFVEFLKAGYHPSLYSIRSKETASGIKIQLASRDAVEQLARRLGLRQLSTKGIYIGRVSKLGKAVKAAVAQTNLKAEGPYYFNELGVIDRELKTTSGDGRFIFFNVDPGSGYVEISEGGESIAPYSLSMVEGGELSYRELEIVGGTLKGRIFNPVDGRGKLLPISGARMKIEGSSEWTNTDSYGAFNLGPLKWIKGESVSLEFSSEKYNNHRYLVMPSEHSLGLNLFAFPANYLGRLAQSMDVDLDPTAGIVMGKVSNLAVRIDALADHSSVNSAKDFYFDSKGKLRGSHTMTDSRYGTYVIFNVPKGRALLQGNDSSGTLRYSESVITGGATISVIMD